MLVRLAGCTQAQLRGYLPGEPSVTNHTDRVTGLWVTSWIVLLIVGIVTWGLIIWAAVAYRRRRGPDRPPGAAALQPPDRDLLHDRAAHPRARFLRLHRA